MNNTPLQELWIIKSNLAKQHDYNLDKLVDYLKKKYPAKIMSQYQKMKSELDQFS